MHYFRRYDLLFFILIILVSSCSKEPGRLGIDLQPDSDKLNVFSSDTSSVIAYSLVEDSVRTDETTVTMLGSYFDPVFGTSTSSVYTQFRLSTSAADFGDNPQLDSVVLSLEYSGSYYGDTSYQQTFRIYEMTESIHIDSNYYSSNSIPVAEPALADMTFIPSPTDSVLIDDILYKAQIRIRLDDSFGNKILGATDEQLASSEAFVDFIKGLYIAPEPVPTGGALLNISLTSTYSRVILYYHNDDDTTKYNFVITDANARFMHFDHYSYQNSDVVFQNQVITGDTLLGAEKVYLQSMAGIKTRIHLPYIRDWVKNQKIAINEARLILTNQIIDTNYAAPPSILLLKRNEDGKNEFMEDYLEGTTYFGGAYDSDNGQYIFRISRYLQNLLQSDSDTDYGLELVVSGASLQANRVVLNGYNPLNPVTGRRITLELIYTKLPN